MPPLLAEQRSPKTMLLQYVPVIVHQYFLLESKTRVKCPKAPMVPDNAAHVLCFNQDTVLQAVDSAIMND